MIYFSKKVFWSGLLYIWWAVLPSRELKSGGVMMMIEDLSLIGLSEKPVHGSRCAPTIMMKRKVLL